MASRSAQTLWETALGQLELQVTRPNFETWLRNTSGLRLDGGQLTVSVPTDFALEWLRSRMGGLINRTASQVAGEAIEVAFEVLGAPAEPVSAPPTVNGASPAPVATEPDLDPRLTFDSFTVVKSNRVAFRAATRLAAAKGSFRLLVLAGPPGLGKTHLLHAIGHEAVAAGTRVLALTSEAFVNRYSSASRRGHPHTFRELFGGCELLLLDELPFLASRSASQEQFFHIFNDLQTSGGRIAVTTEVLPPAIDGLSTRLRSRLSAGMTAQLQPPSPTERFDLLSAMAKPLAQPLEPATLRFIATQPYTSVRELEGALHRVAAYSEFSEEPLSTDTVQHALYPFASTQQLTPDDILDTVCRHFNLSLSDLSGASRSREITYARHIAMYLLRSNGPHALTEIGRLMGGRDHTTVLNAFRRIQKERTSYPQTRVHIEQIEAELRSQSIA